MRRFIGSLLLLMLLWPCLCFAFEIEPAKVKPTQPTLNLVFAPLDYQDKGQFSADVQHLSARLNKTKPFDEFNNKIALWKVSLSKKEQAQIFKRKQEFPYLAVRQDFLKRISRQLEAPYKLVIVNTAGSSSCAELSCAEKPSLIILGKGRYKDEDSFAKGFLHELGHSLGLRDESLNNHARLCPAGPPNCAQNKVEAEQWWGDLVSGQEGVSYIWGCCGNKRYLRPTIASLMNDPEKAEGFGPVNERYLRRIFIESIQGYPLRIGGVF